AATVGLPYFALATTGPLLAAWWSARSSASPYRLYALSNLGSLLGLWCYPLVLEPLLDLPAQGIAFALGFVVFALAVAACAVGTPRVLAPPPDRPSAAGASAAGPARRAAWLIFPGVASVLLLGTTNQLCQDVAAIP